MLFSGLLNWRLINSTVYVAVRRTKDDGHELVRGLLGDCLYEFEQEIKNDPEYSLPSAPYPWATAAARYRPRVGAACSTT
jgi:hypothetical protein